MVVASYQLMANRGALALRQGRSGLLAGVVLLCATGCANLAGTGQDARYGLSGPDEVRASLDLPTGWQAGDDAALAGEALAARLPLTNWVEGFDDARLEAFVADVLDRNADIGVAFANLEASAAGLRISRASRLPVIGYSADVNRTERALDPFVDLPDGADSDTTSLSAALSGSWEADIWGRIGDRIRASSLDVAASEFELAAIRLSIAGLAVRTYFQAVEAEQLVALSDSAVEARQRAVTLTERRYTSGVVGRSDVSLARSQLASARALRFERIRARDEAVRRLEVFMRRYPGAEFAVASAFPELNELPGVIGPDSMLARRPDLLARDARLAAQGVEVAIARKALLPRLSLQASGASGAGSLRRLFDVESLVGTLASNLAGPIFQGGRLRADIDLQKALSRRLAEDYVGATLTALREVEDSLAADRYLLLTLRELEGALDEAREAEQRLERRYEEGLATILQLLDAQSRRLLAEEQLISATSRRLDVRTQLYVALGGEALGLGTEGEQVATAGAASDS